MTLADQVQVDMPPKGVHIRRGNNSNPVYLALRSFRNAQGTSTKERVCIGKEHPETGKLIPNARYWTLFGLGENARFTPVYESVRQVGWPFVAGSTLNSLGLSEILSECLGAKRSELVKTSVMYMAAQGNVFDGVADYCSMHLMGEAPLNSQMASQLFASISHDERMGFFKAWVSKQKPGGYLAYDVTSFSTYAKGIADSEYGHNRDNEKLPQINLGCFVHEATSLPIFYVTYPGSIVDKSYLPKMMAYNDELGINDIGFILDRGFCSTSNIQFLDKSKYRYIIGVEKRHKTTRTAIESVRANMEEVKNVIEFGVFGLSRHGCFYGVTSTMHIYFDRMLASRQLEDFCQALDKDESFLRQKKALTSQEIKKHGGYFLFEQADNGSLAIKRNSGKIELAAKDFGFFCLLTNTSLTSSEVLEQYRRKDAIEKSFDDVKNHIDMKRLRTHTTATTDGKIFCAFLALIVASEIGARLGEFMKKKSMSKAGLIREMDKIYAGYDKNGWRLLNPVTKTQRLLINGLGLVEDDLQAYITARS